MAFNSGLGFFASTQRHITINMHLHCMMLYGNATRQWTSTHQFPTLFMAIHQHLCSPLLLDVNHSSITTPIICIPLSNNKFEWKLTKSAFEAKNILCKTRIGRWAPVFEGLWCKMVIWWLQNCSNQDSPCMHYKPWSNQCKIKEVLPIKVLIWE